MKKQEKSKLVVEDFIEDNIPAQKKKIQKPWSLEYKIVDEAYANQHSFFKNTYKVGEWIKDTWFDKLLSVKHGIEQMNKIARSVVIASKGVTPINDHWRFAGREFRMVNSETKEIVPLNHTDTEFYAERTEGEDPS